MNDLKIDTKYPPTLCLWHVPVCPRHAPKNAPDLEHHAETRTMHYESMFLKPCNHDTRSINVIDNDSTVCGSSSDRTVKIAVRPFVELLSVVEGILVAKRLQLNEMRSI